MHVARRTVYALETLRALATLPAGKAAAVRELAAVHGLPRPFLQVILVDLRRHGFVQATRGQRGGYRLSRPAVTMSVAEVIRAMQGPLRAAACSDRCCEEDKTDQCRLGPLWREAEAAVRNVYARTTVADLAAGLGDRAREYDTLATDFVI